MLEEKRQTSALTWGVPETLGRAAGKLFRAVTQCVGPMFVQWSSQIGKGVCFSDSKRMGQSRSESRHLFTNQTYLLLSLPGKLG